MVSNSARQRRVGGGYGIESKGRERMMGVGTYGTEYVQDEELSSPSSSLLIGLMVFRCALLLLHLPPFPSPPNTNSVFRSGTAKISNSLSSHHPSLPSNRPRFLETSLTTLRSIS